MRREVRIEGEPEQATVPVVVHLRAQVREDSGSRTAQVVEDLDDAALLGDEDASVGREAHGGGSRQTAEDDLILDPGRQGSCVAGLRGEESAEARRDPNRD